MRRDVEKLDPLLSGYPCKLVRVVLRSKTTQRSIAIAGTTSSCRGALACSGAEDGPNGWSGTLACRLEPP